MQYSNPNDAYNHLIHVYTTLLDKNIPLKTVKFNPYKHKLKNWITHGLLTSMKKKDTLFYKLKRTKNPQERNRLAEQHKKYKTKLTQLIRAAKNKY
jgi:hypothetical protein